MKKSIFKSTILHQLSGAAVALAAVALFSFVNPAEKNFNTTTGEDAPGGGMSVAKPTAQQLMANMAAWKGGTAQKGGYLSKRALDAMFEANPDANGIYWYMGCDDKGTELKLIVEPAQSRLNLINKTTVSNIYVSETTCPTECGSLAN